MEASSVASYMACMRAILAQRPRNLMGKPRHCVEQKENREPALRPGMTPRHTSGSPNNLGNSERHENACDRQPND